jgi:hypothetical protein
MLRNAAQGVTPRNDMKYKTKTILLPISIYSLPSLDMGGETRPTRGTIFRWQHNVRMAE